MSSAAAAATADWPKLRGSGGLAALPLPHDGVQTRRHRLLAVHGQHVCPAQRIFNAWSMVASTVACALLLWYTLVLAKPIGWDCSPFWAHFVA